jgi:hypothetical protein
MRNSENSLRHVLGTRQNMDLHMNQVNLAIYGKGVFHMDIKVFNELPNEIKETYSDPKKFKGKIKNFWLLIPSIQ